MATVREMAAITTVGETTINGKPPINEATTKAIVPATAETDETMTDMTIDIVHERC